MRISLSLISTSVSPNNTWFHVAFVLSSTNALIYVNGSLNSTGTTTNKPNNLQRTSNFIGKSLWTGDGFSNAIIDELKIFNRSLSQLEILIDMTNPKYGRYTAIEQQRLQTLIGKLFFYNYKINKSRDQLYVLQSL